MAAPKVKTGWDSKTDKSGGGGDVFRFYMPQGADPTEITFLDDVTEGYTFKDPDSEETYHFDAPVIFDEHQLKLNGSWMNWFTCIAGIEEGVPCPLCAANDSASEIAIFTVIDHSKFTSNRTQRVYKDQKKLYVVKTNTMTFDLVRELQDDEAKKNKKGEVTEPGNIRGLRVRVKRMGGNTSPNVGNNFKVLDRYEEDDVIFTGKDWDNREEGEDPKDKDFKLSDLQPYNYLEEFQTKKASALKQVSQVIANEGEDPVPF